MMIDVRWGRVVVLMASWVILGLAGSPSEVFAQDNGDETLLERRANLAIEDVSVQDALRALQAQSGVAIGFSRESLPRARRVTCACTSKTVREALDVILKGTNLVYVPRRNQILVIRDRGSDNGPRTTQTVGGFVRVVGSDRAVATARVELLELGIATLTDADGRFSISSVPPGTYTVRVDALGFSSPGPSGAEVDLDGPTILALELDHAPLELAEIVVVPGTFGMMGDTATFIRQTLDREEMEALPQFGEDVFRVMERIPGVATGDISAKMSVRGGNTDELLIMLDGTELFEPYHLKDLDAVLGIVDVRTLSGVSLVTGGLTTEYGDGMSGLFDMRTQRPIAEQNSSSVGLSISNITVRNKGSFADGRGGWLFSARKGFLDIVLALAGGEDTNDDLSPQYFDVMGKVDFLVSDDHLLSAHVLHAGDDLDLIDGEGTVGQETLNTNWTNTYGWLKWNWGISRSLDVSTVLSAARVERSRSGRINSLGNSEVADIADVDDRGEFEFTTLRQDWRLALSNAALLKFGGQVRLANSLYSYSNLTGREFKQPDGTIGVAFDSVRASLDPDATEAGAYVATRLQPHDRLTVEVGGRYDYKSHTGDSDFSPRVQAALDLTANTTLRASWGRYFQSHGVEELSVVDADTTFFPSERAEQVSLGLQHSIGTRAEFRVEVYRRTTSDPRPRYLNVGRQIIPFPEVSNDRVRFVPERGQTKGLEVLASGPLGSRADWSLTYVLSRAEDLFEGRWVPRILDQRHTVNARWHFKPNQKWELSAGWQYHTGWPSTPAEFQIDTIASDPDDRPFLFNEIPGEINSIRLPTYHRMDLRATREFRVGSGRLSVFLDIFNVYNRENLRSFEYGVNLDSNGRATVIQRPGESMFPILPSFGFTWEF